MSPEALIGTALPLPAQHIFPYPPSSGQSVETTPQSPFHAISYTREDSTWIGKSGVGIYGDRIYLCIYWAENAEKGI